MEKNKIIFVSDKLLFHQRDWEKLSPSLDSLFIENDASLSIVRKMM
jgi:hypothetical protein